jgi:hypothetical protein
MHQRKKIAAKCASACKRSLKSLIWIVLWSGPRSKENMLRNAQLYCLILSNRYACHWLLYITQCCQMYNIWSPYCTRWIYLFFSISRHRFSRLQKRYRRTKTSLRANKFAKSKMGFMIQSLNALYSAVYCTAYRVQLFCAYYLSDRKFLFLRYSISHVYSSTSPNTACVLRMLCFPPVVFDHQGEQFGADRVIQYMEKLRITQHEVNSHKSQSD